MRRGIKIARNISYVFFILILFSTSTFASSLNIAIEDRSQPFEGEGTVENPYRFLIGGESRVVWKHLVTIKKSGDIEVYECHEEDDINKKMLYRYTFNPQNLKETPDGPYYLGLRKYDEEKTQELPESKDSLYFSLANKREFPGKVQIMLDVSGKFCEGESLTLMYYGGYDSTVIHGGAPTVMADEILDVQVASTIEKNVIVKNGYVRFSVRNGGNFVLANKELDFSGLEGEKILHYDSTKVLGTIEGLFPNKKIAEIISEKLDCKTTDIVTQGDIDTIHTLYLAGLELTNIDEISRTCFFNLENLDLSENKLESIEYLSMPHLKNLNISNNKLNSLTFISELKDLKIIDASTNKIVNLPNLNDFTELLSLDLHQNNLEVLPPLENTKLRYLDISENSKVEIKGNLEEIQSVVADSQSSVTSESVENYKLIVGIGLFLIVIATIVVGLVYTKKRENGEKRYEK